MSLHASAFANDLAEQNRQCTSIVELQTFVPSAHDKGSNAEGIPDLHYHKVISFNNAAGPCTFAAFWRHKIRSSLAAFSDRPHPFDEFFSKTAEDDRLSHSKLSDPRLKDNGSYWGSFLATRVAMSSCNMHEEAVYNFQAKRRKLYSTPLGCQVPKRPLHDCNTLHAPRDTTVDLRTSTASSSALLAVFDATACTDAPT